MAFVLSSPDFSDGQMIPAKYTCDGENLSPPLQWSGALAATRSFVLIIEDPDAPSGVFRHWPVYNLPPEVAALPEGIGGQASAEELHQGVNDFGHAGYDGPCPPRGHGTHHYHFRLAALDTSNLTVSPAAKVADVWRSRRAPYPGPNGIGGHLLAVTNRSSRRAARQWIESRSASRESESTNPMTQPGGATGG
jgi:Raf kinase inhibitor-like YbhB/YbcL family protein